MRIDYRRDPDSSSLVLSEEGQPDVASYQVRMLMANELEGFLKCRVHQMDGALLFYYDITSRQPLEILFQHQKITGTVLVLLLGSLVEALETMKNYLLDMDALVLDPRFIYTDAEKRNVWFCYLPGRRKPLGKQLREFGEFLLPKLDNQDREGVVLGYAFYQLAVRESFTADEIRALLHGKREMPEGHSVPEKPDVPPDMRDRADEREEQKIPETREELLEAFFMPEEETEKKDWKRLAVPCGTGAAAVAVAAAVTWMGEAAAGLAAGAALTLAVLIPYYAGQRKKERKEEEDRMERYSKAEGLRETDLYPEQEAEELQPGEKTVYLENREENGGACLIPTGGGENLRLDKQVILLGKSRQYADLQLPSSAVSRLHARMVWNGETYEVGDLNSRNGTWINEKLLDAETMEALQDGDKIRFADLTYLYRK